MKHVKGVILVMAVSALFATTTFAKAKSSKAIKCMGANQCKGKSECGAKGHACKGFNKCKGTGWIKVGTKKECKAKGGRPVK